MSAKTRKSGFLAPLVCAVATSCLSFAVAAADPAAAPVEFDEPPPPPDPVVSGQVLEPDITIVQKDDKEIEEYRINGFLYMVKVTPSIGPSYYLLDNDGDGKMERRMSVIYSDFTIPKWVLFSW